MNSSIYLITNELRPRQIKIGLVCKALGYNVKLCIIGDSKKSFSGFESLTFSNATQFLLYTLKNPADYYYVLAVWDLSFPKILINEGLGPLIFETYDLLGGCVNEKHPNFSEIILEDELYCVTNADYSLFRDYRLNLFEDYWSCKVTNGVIILDGCLASKYAARKRTFNLKNLRFVYVGNLPNPTSKSPRNYHAEFAERISSFNSTYDIYPLNLNTFYCWNEFLLAAGTKLLNLKVHKPIHYPSLLQVISSFDVGVDLLSINGPRVDCNEDFYTMQCSNNASNNKIFDYIDAGLQVITPKTSFNQNNFEKIEGVHFISSFSDIASSILPEVNNRNLPIDLTMDGLAKIVFSTLRKIS